MFLSTRIKQIRQLFSQKRNKVYRDQIIRNKRQIHKIQPVLNKIQTKNKMVSVLWTYLAHGTKFVSLYSFEFLKLEHHILVLSTESTGNVFKKYTFATLIN